MRAREIVLDQVEDDFVFRHLDPRAGGEGHRHDDALAVDQGAVAAPEVDDLILVAVVAADEGVLARDERAAAEADGVVGGAPDGGGVADGEFERFARERGDPEFGWHGWEYLAAGRVRQA